MAHKPRIIAISSVSGGGKTTTIHALKNELPHCAVLSFDDYHFEKSPEDIIDWVNRGAEFDYRWKSIHCRDCEGHPGTTESLVIAWRLFDVSEYAIKFQTNKKPFI